MSYSSKINDWLIGKIESLVSDLCPSFSVPDRRFVCDVAYGILRSKSLVLGDTDTGIALRAAELDADAILLAKNIDGVYTADPKIDPQAERYDQISIKEVVEKELGVIDLTASVMCMENHIPLMIFDLKEKNSIVNAMTGHLNGTLVTA